MIFLFVKDERFIWSEEKPEYDFFICKMRIVSLLKIIWNNKWVQVWKHLSGCPAHHKHKLNGRFFLLDFASIISYCKCDKLKHTQVWPCRKASCSTHIFYFLNLCSICVNIQLWFQGSLRDRHTQKRKKIWKKVSII